MVCVCVVLFSLLKCVCDVCMFVGCFIFCLFMACFVKVCLRCVFWCLAPFFWSVVYDCVRVGLVVIVAFALFALAFLFACCSSCASVDCFLL